MKSAQGPLDFPPPPDPGLSVPPSSVVTSQWDPNNSGLPAGLFPTGGGTISIVLTGTPNQYTCSWASGGNNYSMTLNWNEGTQRLQGKNVSINVEGGNPLPIPGDGRVSICANANGYWGGYLGGSPGGPLDDSPGAAQITSQTAGTGTFIAQAPTGGQNYGTLLRWEPGRSGLPENLFQPHCVIEVSLGVGAFLSWPYGGGGGGTCTLGPLPQVIPPGGQKPAEVTLTIPHQPSQHVGINVDASSPAQARTYLTNLSTGGAGVFTTQVA